MTDPTPLARADGADQPEGVGAIVASLRRAGLIDPVAAPSFTALTGGVASDIWRIDGRNGPFVVKRALAKLRVAADWQVPVSRNAAEAEWLRVAAAAAPGAAPEILLHDADAGFIAMSYLEPARHPVWKAELSAGRADPAFAVAVGERLARIHTATAGRAELAARVNDDALFAALRLDPYLGEAGRRHPDLAATLAALSAQCTDHRVALVHGDISPKNILCGPEGPILLDAECAWYGDPAFDLGFCLNHLLLKCLWVPAAADRFLASFAALAAAYLGHVRFEPAAGLEARAARLLPGLLLARVDGKSPVEYLTDPAERAGVSAAAQAMLRAPATRLSDIADRWRVHLSSRQEATRAP